jgi:hypothetical protein
MAMSRLVYVLKNEPTALGTTVASVAPVLVLLGVLSLDENGIAALIVAINALVGFAVRVAVTPTRKVDPPERSASSRAELSAASS